MNVITEQAFVKSATAAGVSIGSRSRELIKQGLSNAVILATIHEEFPNGKTTMACIAWYKSDMRKKGLLAKRGEVEITKYFKLVDGVKAEMSQEEVDEYLASQE
jgi:hypothetical protein